MLRTEQEIRAAGAAAVKGWRLTDDQVNRLAEIVSPLAPNRSARPGRAA
ncbi:hypothetical protein [Micromonospora sp. Llam0]|nr:hypothetical protein [Micromonospora sp. Llam0]